MHLAFLGSLGSTQCQISIALDDCVDRNFLILIFIKFLGSAFDFVGVDFYSNKSSYVFVQVILSFSVQNFGSAVFA